MSLWQWSCDFLDYPFPVLLKCKWFSDFHGGSRAMDNSGLPSFPTCEDVDTAKGAKCRGEEGGGAVSMGWVM